MKVALLSFHNAFNYGAALQAYALQCAVEEMGVQCEYINYVNEHRKNAYDMHYQLRDAIKNRNIPRAIRVAVGTPFINSRGKKFKKFYQAYLKRTEKVYRTSYEARELNEQYDKFIVGSDQVWNTENNGGDTAYLLDFVENPQKRISYSSSFGMGSVPESFKEEYRKNLLEMGRLAVREEAGVKIVKELTGREAHLVLDPVFLVSAVQWRKLCNQNDQTKERYIFFYTNNGSQVNDFLSTGFSMEGLKSHILSSYVTPKDFIDSSIKVRVSMSPIDFLREIASSEMVVTASFHCLAFAIIFHKPFCVILTGNRGKDERLLNLLKITGLESRILDSNTTIDELKAEIDYEHVDSLLSPYLNYSKDYLRRAILSEQDITYMGSCEDGSERFFCQDERCCGCTACEAICPVGAISMRADIEGFLAPFRDEGKCINCYRCHDVCQVFGSKKKSLFTQQYFAAKNEDEVRANSSSGGVFTAISDVVLAANGVVVAASMGADYRVNHIIIDNKAQRDATRGTFYVQSNLGNVFKKVRDILRTNRTVLFVGTPCQVQGLRNYIGSNDELLFTCDLVCHGVPSPLVFEKYVEYLKEHGNLSQYRFRDKSLGWKNGYTVSAVINDRKVTNTLWLQSFLKMFSKSMINRRSCSNCQFSSYERVGDITIGDFWGIAKSKPELIDSKGVSLLICNTEKGYQLLTQSKGLSLFTVKKEETKQNSLIRPSEPSTLRSLVLRSIREKGYEATAKKFGGQNAKGWIKEQIRRVLY